VYLLILTFYALGDNPFSFKKLHTCNILYYANDARSNSAQISRKIAENIMKWERFGLSLPGRIQIAKTMLYSQLNYLGCFLELERTIYDNWENQIYRYVAGNLKIGKQRVFQSTDLGGLGLFKVEDFLNAQKIRWIVYASRVVDADWKKALNKAAICNLYRFDPN
jgi:hypothetical protein